MSADLLIACGKLVFSLAKHCRANLNEHEAVFKALARRSHRLLAIVMDQNIAVSEDPSVQIAFGHLMQDLRAAMALLQRAAAWSKTHWFKRGLGVGKPNLNFADIAERLNLAVDDLSLALDADTNQKVTDLHRGVTVTQETKGSIQVNEHDVQNLILTLDSMQAIMTPEELAVPVRLDRGNGGDGDGGRDEQAPSLEQQLRALRNELMGQAAEMYVAPSTARSTCASAPKTLADQYVRLRLRLNDKFWLALAGNRFVVTTDMDSACIVVLMHDGTSFSIAVVKAHGSSSMSSSGGKGESSPTAHAEHARKGKGRDSPVPASEVDSSNSRMFEQRQLPTDPSFLLAGEGDGVGFGSEKSAHQRPTMQTELRPETRPMPMMQQTAQPFPPDATSPGHVIDVDDLDAAAATATATAAGQVEVAGYVCGAGGADYDEPAMFNESLLNPLRLEFEPVQTRCQGAPQYVLVRLYEEDGRTWHQRMVLRSHDHSSHLGPVLMPASQWFRREIARVSLIPVEQQLDRAGFNERLAEFAGRMGLNPPAPEDIPPPTEKPESGGLVNLVNNFVALAEAIKGPATEVWDAVKAGRDVD